MAEGEAFQSLMQFPEPDHDPDHGSGWPTTLKSFMKQHNKRFSLFQNLTAVLGNENNRGHLGS